MDPITGTALTLLAVSGYLVFDKDDEETIRPGVRVDVITSKKAEKAFAFKSVKKAGQLKKVAVVVAPDTQLLETRRTGPLPAQALACQKAKWDSPNNRIRSRGQWFDVGQGSKGWKHKRDRLRFYAKPAGAPRIISKSKTFNIAWMARCPLGWYPKYGRRDQSCRLDVLTPIIGPKAGLRAFGKGLARWFEPKAIAQRFKAAGVLTGAVFTAGGSLTVKGKKQIQQVVKTIKGDIRIVRNELKSKKQRKKAAAAIVETYGVEYRKQLAAANPHCIRGGRFDVSPRFMANPKTYADLFKPGKSWPVIYNPPPDISVNFWPNR
jgi:hypothetical protein